MSDLRPTPETDAACFRADYYNAGQQTPVVHADFARNLERERDEALAARNDIGARWQRIATTAEAERDEARKKLEAMREAIKEAWIEIQYAEAGFAGLALRVCPNDSAVESVLNRMTEALAKLQPFLKP